MYKLYFCKLPKHLSLYLRIVFLGNAIEPDWLIEHNPSTLCKPKVTACVFAALCYWGGPFILCTLTFGFWCNNVFFVLEQPIHFLWILNTLQLGKNVPDPVFANTATTIHVHSHLYALWCFKEPQALFTALTSIEGLLEGKMIPPKLHIALLLKCVCPSVNLASLLCANRPGNARISICRGW